MLRQLFYEDRKLSYTRVASAVLLVLFVFITLYLVFFDIVWSHFDTMAAVTVGGGMGGQVLNKGINSKYNSPAGAYRNKEERSEGE